MTEEPVTSTTLNLYELDALQFPAPACYYIAGRLLQRIGWHRAYFTLSVHLTDQKAAKLHRKQVPLLLEKLADLALEFEVATPLTLAKLVRKKRTFVRSMLLISEWQKSIRRICQEHEGRDDLSIFNELARDLGWNPLSTMRRDILVSLAGADSTTLQLFELETRIESAISPRRFALFDLRLADAETTPSKSRFPPATATECDIRIFNRTQRRRNNVLPCAATSNLTSDLDGLLSENCSILGKGDYRMWFPPRGALRPGKNWPKDVRSFLRTSKLWSDQFEEVWHTVRKQVASSELTSEDLMAVIGQLDALILHDCGVTLADSPQIPDGAGTSPTKTNAAECLDGSVDLIPLLGERLDETTYIVTLRGDNVEREGYPPVKVKSKVLRFVLNEILKAKNDGITAITLQEKWPKVKKPDLPTVKRQIRYLNKLLETLKVECSVQSDTEVQGLYGSSD